MTPLPPMAADRLILFKMAASEIAKSRKSPR